MPKKSGRVMMGVLSKSPKNKQKCLVKLVCKLENYIQIGKMASALWVRALFPTRLGIDHIRYILDLVCFWSNFLK